MLFFQASGGKPQTFDIENSQVSAWNVPLGNPGPGRTVSLQHPGGKPETFDLVQMSTWNLPLPNPGNDNFTTASQALAKVCILGVFDASNIFLYVM